MGFLIDMTFKARYRGPDILGLKNNQVYTIIKTGKDSLGGWFQVEGMPKRSFPRSALKANFVKLNGLDLAIIEAKKRNARWYEKIFS